ncbi:related to General amino-acid permease GAP1 [Hanseniaspora guilliermondii]|uniref:Related to General amino-acid permease GAP1 n=1 Tax=Hanseniaspora guilliermondii TaxID=56406 RepID=A0A1L0CNP7_9ASCO|nr:related to General amino-acid permease GAP1 [Hanseniaspora guilliermondii]
MTSSIIEKATELEAGITNVSSSESSENKIERVKSQLEWKPSEDKTYMQNFLESFKRVELEEIDPTLSVAEKIAIKTARTPLKKKLKNRHLQMIAIGGAIGTGLFVGAGSSLSTAGPAGVLIGYLISATFIICVVLGLGELAVEFPVSGSFTTYANRFVDESFGFAANWNYVFGCSISLPLELVSASITVDYWGTPKKYRDAFVALFLLVLIVINLFGVKGYGEAEIVFSAVKVVTIIGFIILGIILVCGGGPDGKYVGGTMWKSPYGAFVGKNGAQRFKTIVSVFISAAFAYAGVEMTGMAAAETKNPRKSVPSAAKQVFWRILLFYIISLTLVGLLVSHKDPRLIGNSYVDAASSPFVIAMENHGIKGLTSLFNVVICISVLSVGNSSIYGASRIMVSMCESGHIPKWTKLDYIDKKGRPLMALLVLLGFGIFSFIAASNKQDEVFTWLLSLTGLSAMFTWFGISLSHIRFRHALKAQGRDTDELWFSAPTGLWGSYYSCGMIALIVVLDFWTSLWPYDSSPNAEYFFEDYLSAPVFILMYLGHKIYRRNWKIFIPSKEVDIITGRRVTDIDVLRAEIAEERAYMATKPFYYRTYKFFC